jgi:hypothetical protein
MNREVEHSADHGSLSEECVARLHEAIERGRLR